jgi:hypothetical protein
MSGTLTDLWCNDEARNAVLANPAHPLNGLDYVEYVRVPAAPPATRHRLELTFLKPPPAALAADPLAFRIDGGIRITGIRVLSVAATANPLRLNVFVDGEGDFSTYLAWVHHPAIDPERAAAAFSFKAGCPSEFDCRPQDVCEPAQWQGPALDYLAKDYQSFRRMMMDLAPLWDPDFSETNPADLTVTLIEMFAAVGDQLSYFQDAAATEAFFDTCRERISAARHARLIDERLGQGRNACGFVQFDGAGPAATILAGTRLITRLATPLRGQPSLPGVLIAAGTADFDADPALAGVTVFETAAPVRVIAARNALHIHDWGDAQCCLGTGTREVYVYAVSAAGVAARPDILAGEYLLLEEVLGPTTGLAADADPRQRHVARIAAVAPAEDGAFTAQLTAGLPTPRTAGDPPLPLLKLSFREGDATPRPFCLSAEHPLTSQLLRQVTIARANVTPADHGLTRVRHWPAAAGATPLPAPVPGVGRWPIDRQPLGDGPLTWQAIPVDPIFAADGRLAVGRHDLASPAQQVMPAITIDYGYPGGDSRFYRPAETLFASTAFDTHMVAETGNDGLAILRFGDDQYGQRLMRGGTRPISARARYRIGNGRAGNIGHGALFHVIEPDAADRVDPANPAGPPLPFPVLTALRQPLPMAAGADPQPIEALRQLAPAAFRAETYRAVTLADWEAVAARLPGVSAARASFRWTGSWQTLFVAIHPADPDDLVRLPGGGVSLDADFAARLTAALARYALAGTEIAVIAAVYVPIELDIRLCIMRGHFRGDVLTAATAALSNRRLPGGATGFFHPSNFRFGTAVYLSRLHAALMAVPGVESAAVEVMKRFWAAPNGELARGLIELAPSEIARLDNDPSQPEFGVLRLSGVGGL